MREDRIACVVAYIYYVLAIISVSPAARRDLTSASSVCWRGKSIRDEGDGWAIVWWHGGWL